jgi:hypothetical protein
MIIQSVTTISNCYNQLACFRLEAHGFLFSVEPDDVSAFVTAGPVSSVIWNSWPFESATDFQKEAIDQNSDR